MKTDRSEHTVTIPIGLREALAGNEKAGEAFEALSYSHRKEHAEWIATAKREETRQSRAEKSVARILAKKRVR